MSGPIIEVWEVFRPSLRRRGREADLTDVPVLKLAEVEKIVVAGDDDAS